MFLRFNCNSVTVYSFFSLLESNDLKEFLTSNATIGESFYLFFPKVQEDLKLCSSLST